VSTSTVAFSITYLRHGEEPRCTVAKNGFAFDRLGVRVRDPRLTAHAAEGREDGIRPYLDSIHCEDVFRMPSFLTQRDANANSFEGLLLSAARPDGDLPRNLQWLCGAAIAAARPADGLSSYQKSLVNLATAVHLPSPAGLRRLDIRLIEWRYGVTMTLRTAPGGGLRPPSLASGSAP